MNNPFVVTGVVEDPAFCNRQSEQTELREHIENSQNVLLFSHRRQGKTSLILKVFKSLNDITPVYIDLYGTTSTDGFIKAFIKGISGIEPKTNRLIKAVRETLSGISVSFGFDPLSNSPTMDVSISRQPSNPDVGMIFRLAQKIAKNKKIVIALDEFQEITGYGDDTFEKVLRKEIQHHSNVSYIFAGSQRHLITEMFNDTKRAFYQMAISLPLKSISTEDYIEWIMGLYQQAKRGMDENIVRDVVIRCENHPRCVQEFFYTLWNYKRVGTNEVNQVENDIIEKRTIEFMHVWDALSLNQKKALKLVAVTSGKQLFSAEHLSAFQFKAASQVAAALKFLEHRELVTKNGEYQIQDPIFRKWVRRMV